MIATIITTGRMQTVTGTDIAGTIGGLPATCTGDLLMATHEAALAHARQRPGWRVPNVKELGSLYDVRRNLDDKIDPVAFPAARAAFFWSSTPYFPVPTSAWFSASSNGEINKGPRSNALSVRLVRVNYAFAD